MFQENGIETPVGANRWNHLLWNGHQLAVHRVGGADNLPQVLCAVQPGQVHQLSLRPQR